MPLPSFTTDEPTPMIWPLKVVDWLLPPIVSDLGPKPTSVKLTRPEPARDPIVVPGPVYAANTSAPLFRVTLAWPPLEVF